MDGTVRIWDVTSGICTGEFGDHDGITVSRVAMNKNFLVSYSDNNNLMIVRDFETGKQLLRIDNFGNELLPGM
jgi:WD40 repeat protein